MLVFFKNFILMEFRVNLFSVIGSFRWFLLKKNLWPLFIDGVQLPQDQSHFEEAVYFLPLSPQKFWYSLYQPRKDERLSRPWSHPTVLNRGPLDWESSAFWMGMASLHKNIQLMLELLNAPFWGLYFSYYILMTFLMMSFVTPLSTLCVIRHLICGNNQNWLLNFNLVCETMQI